jgi:hypothetical protein
MVSARFIALAASVIALAGAAPAHQDDRTRATYRELVDAYRHQDMRAVDDVLGLVPPSVDSLVTGNSIGPWSADDLRAAAMLHTDAALKLIERRQAADASVQLNAAVRLMDEAVARTPRLGAYARRWYVVIAALLDARGAPEASRALRDLIALRFPETASQVSARQAFERGLDLELRAAMEGPVSRSDKRDRNVDIDPQALAWLAEAAAAFESALTQQPGLADAALHLGRARIVRQQDAAAVRPLELASAADDARVRYLALLCLGGIAERQERFDTAKARYREAAAAFPWGQSATFALAQLSSRTGNEADARATMAEHFARTRGRVVEPLWTYLVTPDDHLRPSLDELRAEVWR